MFNLPWYSWLNVLALPIIWGCMSFDFSVKDAPAWARRLIKFHILAAVCVIFLYWNPQIYNSLVPLNYLLAVAVLPYAAWNMITSASGFIDSVYKYTRHLWDVKKGAKRLAKTLSTTPETASTPASNLEDADIDLDECMSNCEFDDELMMRKLLKSDSAGSEKYHGVMSILGADEEPDSLLVSISFGVFLLYSVLCLPPLYMSVILLGR